MSELRFFTVEAVEPGWVSVDDKGKVRTAFLDSGSKTVLLTYCERSGIQSGVVFRNRRGTALSCSDIWCSMKKSAEKVGTETESGLYCNLIHRFAVERYKVDKDIETLRLDSDCCHPAVSEGDPERPL